MSSRQHREHKSYPSTPAGLREALFDELADLRGGVTTPHYAMAVSKIAGNVIASYEVELRQDLLNEAKRHNSVIEERALLAAPVQPQLEDHSGDARFEDAEV